MTSMFDLSGKVAVVSGASSGLGADAARAYAEHGADVALLARVLLLSLGALACGVLLGVGAAGLGVSLPDPYLGATLLASALPVLVGVIVPVSAYPAWLRVVSQVTPLSGAVSTLTAGGPALVLRDLALSAVWCAAGLVVSQVAVHRLRQGARYDTV